jgi:hypothetical protein
VFDSQTEIRLLGVRHHGPGSARAVLQSLRQFQPDQIALEMPGDAVDLLPWIGDESLVPPVALLLYPRDRAEQGVFFPLAEFSPEWQCLKYAHAQSIPIQPIDLPIANRIAVEDAMATAESLRTESPHVASSPENDGPRQPATDPPETYRGDPIGRLAAAAGCTDGEQWWEHQVERCEQTDGLFGVILEAMTLLRESQGEVRRIDLMREAHMRQSIRRLIHDGATRIAVVCGAWHAPVLTEQHLRGKVSGTKKTNDAEMLRGIGKERIVANWVPYSHNSLRLASGYGAGVESPGWYQHLWRWSHSDAAAGWISQAARLMRNADLDASTASVIDAVRLAETLASMRRRHRPGLAELREAIRAVLGGGDDTAMQLIRRRLEIGDTLGQIPAKAPTVPLVQDLVRWQKRVRLKPTTEPRQLDLDLRNDNGLARSILLTRLSILQIPWGQRQPSASGRGTFRESWLLCWDPQFEIALVQASIYGTTVQRASERKAVHDAKQTSTLRDIATQAEVALRAELPVAARQIMQHLDQQSALAFDVQSLLGTISPLAQIVRYSNVRQTAAEDVLPVLTSLFHRGATGFTTAIVPLDEAGCRSMLEAVEGVGPALNLIDRDDLLDVWYDKLQQTVKLGCAALLRGWATRELMAAQRLTAQRFEQLIGRALSPAVPPHQAAAWIEGLLRGGGTLLLYQDLVWMTIDHWLTGIDATDFDQLLPLLRRTFSTFSPAQRRQMGQRVASLRDRAKTPPGTQASDAATSPPFDDRRARSVWPVLREIYRLDRRGDAAKGGIDE